LRIRGATIFGVSTTLRCSECFGSKIPQPEALTRQFLLCLKAGGTDSRPYRELADHYESHGQRFNAMLCLLSALAIDPGDEQALHRASALYAAGILKPTAFQATEPESCMVSVILATQNRPDTLPECVESVLCQTLGDFEVLVINDGGPKEIEALVNQFRSPRGPLLLEGARGHRTAMNLGLKIARGKYIAYLDDDDVYFPTTWKRWLPPQKETTRSLSAPEIMVAR